MSIYEKLNRIQVELKAPKNSYNNFGKYKYRNLESILEALKPLLDKYKCVLLLNDSIEMLGNMDYSSNITVTPALSENGEVLYTKKGEVIYTTNTIYQNRFYIKSTATIIDAEAEAIEGDFSNRITTVAYAREEDVKKGMDASQLTGASSSYARKYALNGLFAIDDTKDSDDVNQGEKPIARSRNNPPGPAPVQQQAQTQQQGFNANSNSNLITENQVKRMYALAKGDVEILKKVLSQFDFTSSKEVTKDKYNSICELIQSLTSK